MSAEEQRRLLEALMGKQALHGIEIETVHFTHESICKDYLCGLCPNDLFVNTKMDMGPCQRQHSEKAKIEYEKAKAAGEHPGYENEWALSLGQFIAECDRKTQQTLKKMDRNPDDTRALILFGELSDLDYEVLVVLEQVQTLGEAGRIAEALRLLDTVQALHERKANIERDLKMIEVGAGATQTQKLRICYRCSASLSIFDSDRRLADHFAGKMHLGFVQIRDKLEELKAAGFGQVRERVDFRRGSREGNRDLPPRDHRDYSRDGRDSQRDYRDSGRRFDRRRSPPRRGSGGRRY